MPGYVKTEEELKHIAAVLRPMRYTLEEVGVEFTTTWEFARWALPPCFEPIGDRAANTAGAAASVVSIECPHFDRFDADHVLLLCKYKGQDGAYILQSLHSNEPHVICGREIWGGPKKLGNARIFHDGNNHYAYSERNGCRLVEIEVETHGPDRGPRSVPTRSFALKMFPHVSGTGLEYQPLLNIWEGDQKASNVWEGKAKLKWGHSKYDHVHTIPIVSVGNGEVMRGAFAYERFTQERIPDPERIYARYLWGTYMDDPTMFSMPLRWRDEVKVNR